jgi:hypothetical protein
MKEKDPYQQLVESASNLKAACKHIIENEKVKPNYETTINYYHQVVMDCLELMEHMQARIENYNQWNARYGEDFED